MITIEKLIIVSGNDFIKKYFRHWLKYGEEMVVKLISQLKYTEIVVRSE